jgi:hypothetical protein
MVKTDAPEHIHHRPARKLAKCPPRAWFNAQCPGWKAFLGRGVPAHVKANRREKVMVQPLRIESLCLRDPEKPQQLGAFSYRVHEAE